MVYKPSINGARTFLNRYWSWCLHRIARGVYLLCSIGIAAVTISYRVQLSSVVNSNFNRQKSLRHKVLAKPVCLLILAVHFFRILTRAQSCENAYSSISPFRFVVVTRLVSSLLLCCLQKLVSHARCFQHHCGFLKPHQHTPLWSGRGEEKWLMR